MKDGIPDNKDCVNHAMKAVEAYAAETGMTVVGLSDDVDELKTAVSDLVIDLFHLCNRHDIDIDALLDNAKTFYDVEIEKGSQEPTANSPHP